MVAQPYADNVSDNRAVTVSKVGEQPAQGIIPPKTQTGPDGVKIPVINPKTGRAELDYNMATPMMLIRYFPTGIVGAGADGANGFVHVGHGRQRDRIQHRLDV